MLFILAPATSVLGQGTPAKPCSDERARQFDFWVGDWTVSSKGKVVGHNSISSIQGGCTLLEEYHVENGPYEGKSFNYFDLGDEQWHQVWVDNGGLRLHLAGGISDGKMIMSGERRRGEETIVDRITWHNNADGTVRQVWDVSKDGGETWSNAFDGLYERTK